MVDPKLVLERFRIDGVIGKVSDFGSGHIHHTYKAENAVKGAPNYLLQQINHYIFTDVSALMDNIQAVTTYLSHQINHLLPEVCDIVLTIIETIDGHLYYRCPEDGSYWRVFVFLDGLRSDDLPSNPKQIYQSGKAFGTFMRLLEGFDAEQLHITIPDFHSVRFRLNNLEKAIDEDCVERCSGVAREIDLLHSLSAEMRIIENLGLEGKIPIRVTHNDTKFNNVLLDTDGIARCVIDLDTVMPGYLLYDFGDAIRTTATTHQEDDDNFSEVDVDLERFEVFSSGFLKPVSTLLTATEREQLPRSCTLLTYLMATRFLTDYLQADVYYNIKYPTHNLVRARNQLALTMKMMDKQGDFSDIIDSILC